MLCLLSIIHFLEMFSPWIYSSLLSIKKRPLDNRNSTNAVFARVLSYDEDSSLIVICDPQYFISGYVSDKLKEKIINNKPDYSQCISNGVLLLKEYIFSKASVPEKEKKCNSWLSTFM